MGLPDNPPPIDSSQDESAKELLAAITENLRGLQKNLSSQMTAEINHLNQRRSQLTAEIESLEADYRQLQNRYSQLQENCQAALSQQQQEQQKLWAKRLAQAIAAHLQQQLNEHFSHLNGSGLPQTNQMLSSLDQSLHATLHSLQQDLNSYQSSLSQQVGRMHSLEQQGETILAALINRLSQQLQSQMVNPAAVNRGAAYDMAPHQSPPSRAGSAYDRTYDSRLGQGRPPSPQSAFPQPSPPEAAAKQAPASSPINLRSGLLLVFLSTIALSFHNVLVGIMGFGGDIFGRFPVAEIFPLNIANSLMLLWLRMIVVLPLMTLVASRIYPRLWRDLRRLIRGSNRRPLFQVIASGCFLFMSQVLIYKSISDVGPGVAVTLLFMYPLITVPLAWFLFGDRPTPLRLVVMFAITIGIVFTALPRISTDLGSGTVSIWGVGAALLASGAFALYLVSMQLSFRKLHPVPVSLLQFITIFVLTSLILILGSFSGFQPSQPSSQWGLYLGGLMLGVLTLLGYLFNNFGVKLMGAAQAAIIASSGPVITAVLAFLIIPGEKTSLAFIQWIGVILVTLGLLSLRLERLMAQKRQAQPGQSTG